MTTEGLFIWRNGKYFFIADRQPDFPIPPEAVELARLNPGKKIGVGSRTFSADVLVRFHDHKIAVEDGLTYRQVLRRLLYVGKQMMKGS